MNLKAFIQKIASWSKAEAKEVELSAETAIGAAESAIERDAYTIRTFMTAEGKAYIAGIGFPISPIEASMSTPAAAPAATALQGSNVNTAVQVALALKAIDASLSVEAIQAATTAALAAAYAAS